MTTATQTKNYVIDPAHSMVEFVARHLMISKVRGVFRKVSGTVTLGDGAIPTQVSADIDATSIDTREPDRDTHLKSADFFDVEHFPRLTFKSTSITPKDDTHFTVAGDLTMRGVTKNVTLAGEVEGRTTDPWGNDRIAYSASGKVNRKDWGLNWNQILETGGVAVGEEVTIDLTVQVIPAK